MSQSLLQTSSALSKKLQSIRYIIAVAAGKGGVGKSSVSVNLSLTLQKLGYQVGVLDADIYGPSLGVMMPLEKNIIIEEGKIIPGLFHNVKVISIAHLKPESQGLMVRAPVANGLIMHCIEEAVWGELDYLIVDFPPGTGDVQLTLMQALPFSGALLVTTPQKVALTDVEKAAHMFHQMGVPILGVIENMSYFLDEKGDKHSFFGEGGGEKVARYFGIPFLGALPVHEEVSRCGDLGISLPFHFPLNPVSSILEKIALNLRDFLFEWEQNAEGVLKDFEYHWKEME